MRRQLIWALALVLATFGVATAQETTSGSLAGEITDNQGASVPGATVTITSAQGARTVVTDSNGRFFAPFLTPGVYGVKVELAGFSPVEQKNIQVRLGARLDLNFSLKVGDLQEVVEVVGAAPTVDFSSTTAGNVLDTEMLKRLPVGRKFTDTLYLVPGVSSSGSVGTANPSIGGGSGLENNYVVDGVNITDVGFGGVGIYNSIHGSLGTGVTTDFIKETQVKTAGFEAEYGQATGGVINIVTQSGGNNFHGAVYGYFRPAGLESSYKDLQTPNGTVNTTGQEQYDFGASISGPLMKDKVFFFASFNPQYETRSFIAPIGPTFPLRALGGVDRKRHTYAYAGKLTWQATTNHRFDISAFGDPSKGDVGPQRATAMKLFTTDPNAGFSSLDYGSHNQSIRYDGIISRNWLVEASFAHSKADFDEVPAVDGFRYTDLRTVPNVITGGLGAFELSRGKNLQYSLKSTNIFDAGGNHQLRYGVSYEDIDYSRIFDYSGPNFTLANGVQTVTGAPVQIIDPLGTGTPTFRATRGRFSPTGFTSQKYTSFFAQDTWQIGKRLTFRPGVRYDKQHLEGIPPGDGAPELCHEGDSRPGAGDGSGPAKTCEFTWKDNWAPRIGATFDLTGNGKAKIYASYGKFFVKIPNDLAARSMAADAGITRGDYRDAALTIPIPNGESVANTTSHLRLAGIGAAIIDPSAKSTYTNEFLTGIEFEAGRSINLGIRYIHRTIPRVLEDIGSLPIVGYLVPGAEDTTVEYAIVNVNANTPVANCCGLPTASFEDPVHKYDAVELTATKNFANNWGMVASYRWSKLKGNFEGFYRNDNGQSDPAITALFDFPTNDPGYTQVGVPDFGFRGDIRYLGSSLGDGQLPNDRPHQLKIYTNYTWSNLNMGLAFNWGSGKVMYPLAGNVVYANGGEIPEVIRGGGICGSGQPTTPFPCPSGTGLVEAAEDDLQLDLHADYTFKLGGGSQRLVFIADAFNLFNRQASLDFDNWTEIIALTGNPNYGQPSAGGNTSTPGFQNPFRIRFGARFEW